MNISALLLFIVSMLSNQQSTQSTCQRILVVFPERRTETDFAVIQNSIQTLGGTIREKNLLAGLFHVTVPSSKLVQLSKIPGVEVRNDEAAPVSTEPLIEYIITPKSGVNLNVLAEKLKALKVIVDGVLEHSGIILVSMPFALVESVQALPELEAFEKGSEFNTQKGKSAP